MTTLLYFAWVRDRIGIGEEVLDLPDSIVTVADLIAWLAGRSPGHGVALADVSQLRVAVDQDFAALDTPVARAREIAIFPPVTGG